MGHYSERGVVPNSVSDGTTESKIIIGSLQCVCEGGEAVVGCTWDGGTVGVGSELRSHEGSTSTTVSAAFRLGNEDRQLRGANATAQSSSSARAEQAEFDSPEMVGREADWLGDLEEVLAGEMANPSFVNQLGQWH